MAYAAASNVAEYTPGLLEGGDNFTSSTKPTKTAVNRFVDAGYAIINGRLEGAGYSTPVAATATIYEQLVDLNSLYAAGRAEMVRMTARTAATERTRSQMFMDQFNSGMDALLKMNLARAGATRASAGALYVGGISSSDKDARNADTDRVKPRFNRGQWRASGTARPSGTDSVSDESE